MTTKSKISKAFKRLEKYNFKVWNFNSNQKIRCMDWVDVVVAGHKKIYLIEMKIGKDTLKSGQLITREFLSSLANTNTFYIIVTESNYQDTIQKILEE